MTRFSDPPTGGPTRRDILAAGATGAAGAFLAPGVVMAQAATGTATDALPADPPPSAAVARKAVGEVEPAILRISREVWENAELSRQEMKSHAIHIRELEAEGFTITSRNTSGYPTAFIAEWTQGTGGPVIAYLPEYDALPGLGNAAEPRPTPGPTGRRGGPCLWPQSDRRGLHGRGLCAEADDAGRRHARNDPCLWLRVRGVAGRQGLHGARRPVRRRGCGLAWHPAPVAATGAVRTAANDGIRVIFRGRTAHAGNSPWDGRSALDAAELFGHAVNQMREHVLPTARIHYIFEAAGVAPNVVPDFAQVWMMIRDKDRPKVSAMTEWARQIADGAAMATQTKAEFDLFFGVWDLLPNDTLINGIHAHMTAVGLDWTEEEQAFARACQAAMGLPEKGMATKVMPVLGEITAGGSTDVGDISWVVPTGLFGWPSLPLGVSLHTWPVTACGGMSIGDKASLATARILAGAGHDLMTQPDLLAAAKADFLKRKGDTKFVSALAADKKPEILPAFMHKAPGDDTLTPGEA